MVTTLTAKAAFSAPLLEDKAAVREQLPKLISRQVQRLLDDAQALGETPNWTTLTVELQPDADFPDSAYWVRVSVVVGESSW